MTNPLEQLIVRLWNGATRPAPPAVPGVRLGSVVSDSGVFTEACRLPHAQRPTHVAILGRTGTGKSSLLRALTAQDIRQDLGFVHLDLHGETTPHVLRLLAREEQRRRMDLSDRVIVIDPADPHWSVGVNVLATRADASRMSQIADMVQILKQRWQLDALGARTEELVRNSLVVLADAQLTLLELAPLLTHDTFRQQCLRTTRSADVRAYFETRYDPSSAAMQATWREAVLNKISAFTTDDRFRHLVGQRDPRVSILDALDRGAWVLVNLDKGRLGEHATTLGSLLLTQIRHALFARTQRTLVTIYADELQNLVAYDSGIDTMLSEARKYGVGICAANQFLDQYPAAIRAAMLAVGTHMFFQLSGPDADRIAAILGGGHHLRDRLRNLPPRTAIVKRGTAAWQQIRVPDVTTPATDPTDLLRRSRERWARTRTAIEQDIARRLPPAPPPPPEVLDDWE